MFLLIVWLVGLIWLWTLLGYFYVTKDSEMLDSRGWLIFWIFTGLIPIMGLFMAVLFTCIRFDRIIGHARFNRMRKAWGKICRWFSSPVFPDKDDWRD